MPEKTVELKLNGREIEPRLPPLLESSSRAVGQPADPFLPPGYLRPTKTFDASPAARGALEGGTELSHDAKADEIVVIELADGGTLVSSAQRLRDTLRLTHPELIGPDGEILLEKLRAEAALPRGFLDEAVGGLISKVYTFVAGETSDAILNEAATKVSNPAELGVTWVGTKALMWAIEKRLDQKPGLYRWTGASGSASDLEAIDLNARSASALAKDPMLVFIHGTGSSSRGSFGDLRADSELWAMLDRRYPGGIYAFEHPTLSESPIENAIALADALPVGARVSLVSHSRGGLVADLLCLGDFDPLIANFRYAFKGTFDPDPEQAKRVVRELAHAHAGQRLQLATLAGLLRERKLVVERYVRVASPARGTLLASGNFDFFLSGLLTLIGQVPFFFGSPWYSAFKRVVIEIAKNRTNPHLVPGIEAMVPDSPMARLLRDAPLRNPIQMAVIAGDAQGGNLLKRFGLLLTDFLLFNNVDNDLVVDTQAMLAGVAPKALSRVLLDRGATVSHFRYFTNQDTRAALGDWLIADAPLALTMFQRLPTQAEFKGALAAATRRGADDADRPIVVVLPGVMGSHLSVDGKKRIWLDPLEIAGGGLDEIGWGKAGIEADELFAMSYGKLCEALGATHRVERFPYDWRQPLDVLADRLGEFLDGLLKSTNQPIRLLAHSMGGLLVRACIYKRRAVMDRLMQRDGARFVMLGTPNQGAHSMVENLIGKGDTLRMLVRVDLKHDMQEVLDIVSGFRGALQLLPKPGFKDMFQGQSGGGNFYDYQEAQTWIDFNAKVSDFWFGDNKSGKPTQSVLDSASWLWNADGATTPELPADYRSKSAYVFGVAPNTPCGVLENPDGRLKMVGTTRGDGTVTWESGRIGGVGQFYYLPAKHGDLAAKSEYFGALAELLISGTTGALSTTPPSLRAVEDPQPVTYDAGPPTADDADSLEHGILGGSLSDQIAARPLRRLEIAVKAMDLRFLSKPIMVGHYEQDPIAGPQALIDAELLDGDLSERHSLGLYAGPRGTAVAVLRGPNALEAQRGSLTGAVVTGLGIYDGAMSVSDLTEAVRAGVLRYLLQVVDVLGKDERDVSLATLLLGYNSSANFTVAGSVEALVRGVIEANARFLETTRLKIRVAELDIVEVYRDTAITAVYELREIAKALTSEAAEQGTLLVCAPELEQGEGVRQRLFDSRNLNYWPRLIVTGVTRQNADDGTSEGAASGAAASQGARTVIADRLRFVYVGQRARAETVMQQRQPGLIETLVRQQIHDSVWREDIGRMLFQLMVPHDFKDAARQMNRVVFVVDSYTANMPWELMLADDPAGGGKDKSPIALRTAMVRQLSTSQFRQQVRQAPARNALIIGNPSVEGFPDAFPLPPPRESKVPPKLPNAEVEAQEIARTVEGLGYTVTRVIGDDRRASDVLAALYRQPYRIVHISAHGVFNLRHKDGGYRSGVLLSDGLLITAAEIASMETVPELVFLNCCHLGQIDLPDGRDAIHVRDGNLLAASIARELIEIGVRCVVVAGWAVNDGLAAVFGRTFYEQLLSHRRAFGDAVLEARKSTWKQNSGDITWGAFQAYGEPAWLAERAGMNPIDEHDLFASPDELLDALARIRANVSRRRELQSDREVAAQTKAINDMLKERCPASWLALPELQSALGSTFGDLGQFEAARAAFLKAIAASDLMGRVPIRVIERLANIEGRMGEAQGDPNLIVDAIRRLDALDLVVTAGSADAARNDVNVERCGLRGGAYKRMASLAAKVLLKAVQQPSALQSAELQETLRFMDNAIDEGIRAYGTGTEAPEGQNFSVYLTLNGLALRALMSWPDAQSRNAAIGLARLCGQRAALDYARKPDIWKAVMVPEALLVERLIDGSLGNADETGEKTYDDLKRAYAASMSNVTIKPVQVDSMAAQMEFLSRVLDVRTIGHSSAALTRTADRLLDLVHEVQPGRPQRADRPPPAAAPKSAAASKPAARQRKGRAAAKKPPTPRAKSHK